MERNPLHPFVIPLYGSSTHFKWGTPGSDSIAARLQTLNRFGAIDPELPYSEFVVSTHSEETGAVLACTPSITLRNHIQNQVIEVDSTLVEFYSQLHSQGLPYILKVVSVSVPQSLHLHPSDVTVNVLAGGDAPANKDMRAKSVMIVALGYVDILFGFQAASDIVGELSRVPEFADAVGRPETDHFVHIVKTAVVKPKDIRIIITNLLSRKRDFMRKCLEATTERLMKMPEEAVTENDRELIALHKVYPDDPACFAVYFLNRLQLVPGNAVFIHPQEPYSVLSGEYIEASTCSEASISAGLTAETVQIEKALESLSYDDSPVEVSTGERFSKFGVSYVPPVPQFQLLDFKLPGDVSQQMVDTIAPSIILVLEGEGVIKVDGKVPLLPLQAGSVYYLNPQTQFLVTSNAKPETSLRLIQIGVNESRASSRSSSCTIM